MVLYDVRELFVGLAVYEAAKFGDEQYVGLDLDLLVDVWSVKHRLEEGRGIIGVLRRL